MQHKEATVIWFDYMDNLRAIALLFGVFFHAAMAYSPFSAGIWPAANSDHSNVLTFLALFTHTFRMPLFFLISGFFAHMILEKRGISGFLKNRAARIFIPFLVFLPLVLISIALGMVWAVRIVEQPSSFLMLVTPHLLDPDNNESQLQFSTGHLWFLYNLFIFCIVLSVMWRVKLVTSEWFINIATPKFILLVIPLLIVPALSTVVAPYPAPDSLIPKLWSFGFFGVFFLMGFIFFNKPRLLDEMKPYAPTLLLISIASYSIYFYLIKDVTLNLTSVYDHEFLWSSLPAVVLEASISVNMTICCLVFGRQFLNRKSKVFSVVSGSSYWVYIVHIPIMLIIQYPLMNIGLSVWLEYLISVFGTLVIGVGTYYLIVKPTPLGWLLNGKPKKTQ